MDLKDESVMIDIQAVWKIYPHKTSDIVALQDIHLKIHKGDFMVLMGPSGSGKSTLMHLIGCLDRPTRGEIRILGHQVERFDDDRMSRMRSEHIGFVFQSFHLIPQLTVLENVMLPFQYRDTAPQKGGEEALERVGLGHRLHHKPFELSGGERQRVSIARALAGNPSIILADEPTGNLDSKTGKVILDLLKELNHQGKTIVIVTHDPHVAQYSQNIIHMSDGKL